MDEKNNDGRQVLVIQNDEDIKPSKWTWAKYGKSIAKFKWWNVGATLGLGLVGFLGVQFGYNSTRSFTAKFFYNLPIRIDSDGDGAFVDGTPFSYFNIISYDNLTSIKETDKAFSKIDVTNITKNNEISIAINGYTDAKTNQFVVSTPVSYTISGKLSSLGDRDTAAKYVKALIESTKKDSESKVNSYSIPNLLPASFSELDFDQQIEKLSDQYDKVDSTYLELESVLSASTTTDTSSATSTKNKKAEDTTSIIVTGDEKGTPIQTIRSEFELRYRDGGISKFTTLMGELENEGSYYVNLNGDLSDDNINTMIQQFINAGNGIRKNILPSIITDINNYTSLLQIVSTGTADSNATLSSYYNTMIENKTKERDEYIRRLRVFGFGIPDAGISKLEDLAKITEPHAKDEHGELIQKNGKVQKLESFKGVASSERENDPWKKGCDAFQTKITEVKTQLLKDIDSGSAVYRFVNNKYRNSVNYYVYPGIISVTGGISPFIGIAAGLVLGFLASSLICCAVYISEEDKKEPMAIEESK